MWNVGPGCGLLGWDVGCGAGLGVGIEVGMWDVTKRALFTGGACGVVGKRRRWKAAVWSPTGRVAEAPEGKGEGRAFAEGKAVPLALGVAEREGWPMLSLSTASRMVANAFWGWFQQWEENSWQRRGKPLWAAELCAEP